MSDAGSPRPSAARSLADRVVVITGGGQGIGRAYAREIAADGGIAVIADVNETTGRSVEQEILAEVDLVLVMSVFPGFGGQKFMGEVLDKVRWLRAQGYQGWIEMDGGINGETIAGCAEAGTDVQRLNSEAGPRCPEIELAHHCDAVTVFGLIAQLGQLRSPHHTGNAGGAVGEGEPEVALFELRPGDRGLQ